MNGPRNKLTMNMTTASMKLRLNGLRLYRMT